MKQPTETGFYWAIPRCREKPEPVEVTYQIDKDTDEKILVVYLLGIGTAAPMCIIDIWIEHTTLSQGYRGADGT